MIEINDDDFDAPQNAPADWEWSGYNQNGEGEISVYDAYLVGVKTHQVSITDNANVTMHIVISNDKNAYIMDWQHLPSGGLMAVTHKHPQAVSRQLHLCFDQMDPWRTKRIKADLLDAVGRRITIHGQVPRIEFGTGLLNHQYNFRGFDVGIQCALVYPTQIITTDSATTKIKQFLSSLMPWS